MLTCLYDMLVQLGTYVVGVTNYSLVVFKVHSMRLNLSLTLLGRQGPEMRSGRGRGGIQMLFFLLKEHIK